MIFIFLIGMIAYFVLPIILFFWIIDKNGNKIFGWYDPPTELVGWGIVLIKLALFIQILDWLGYLN